MEDQKRKRLIYQNTVEVLGEKNLDNLLAKKIPLKHYIGFEISGLVHLGTGLMSAGKIADFLKARAECNILLADWHTYINDKLNGDWEIIKKVAQDYFREAMIASLACFGIKGGKVNFILASDIYKNPIHWQNLMKVSKNITLSRVKRSLDIAGREAGESVDFAKLIYPPLQVADIFTLKINLAHAGLDQRKAHVIARKVAKNLGFSPPVAVHHPLLLGLQKPSVWPIKKLTRKIKISFKMSKSNPKSCIFVHDQPEEIRQKIQKAFCPPQEIIYNPLINWAQYLIFWEDGVGELKIKRPLKFGGNKTYYSIDELKTEYQQGNLHPADLKNAVAEWLINKLKPARDHFKNPKLAKSLDFTKNLIGQK